MEFLDDPAYRIPYLISNGVALFMLFLAVAHVKWGRRAYATLFLWAAWMNASVAWNDPISYLRFADLTFSEFYRDFMLNTFAPDIQRYMAAVAVLLGLTALGITVGGIWRVIASIGGILFFLIVAPFGVGSALRCTLILALGLFIILWKHIRSRRTLKQTVDADE